MRHSSILFSSIFVLLLTGAAEIVGSVPAHAGITDKFEESEACKARAPDAPIRRIALVVGNNTVMHVKTPAASEDNKPAAAGANTLVAKTLANAVRDATLMADTLSDIGFEVDAVSELTKAELLEHLDQFAARTSELCKDDIALFYFAGNGYEISRVSYIGTTDAQIPADLETEELVMRGWVNSLDILDRLKVHRGPKFVILDTCRTDPMQGLRKEIAKHLMPDVRIPTNTLIAYASEPGQDALDGDPGGNGPYAAALAQALPTTLGPAEEVFRKVREIVAASTRDVQHPFIESTLTREVFLKPQSMPPVAGTRSIGEDDTSAPSPATDSGSMGGRVALVIGNGNYISPIAPDLKNPKNDAHAVADVLRRLGFRSVIEKHDLDKTGMLNALRDFGDIADKADWAVVYFAGHGIEMKGQGYVLPVDVRLERDSDVELEGVSILQVLSRFEGTRMLGLFIVDACRNNPWIPHMQTRLQDARDFRISDGLPRIEPDQDNVLVAYSTKHGTKAFDGSGQSNSPYIEALLERIEQPGLEIDMMFRLVRDAVRKKTKTQQPFVYGSLPAEPLYFKPPAPVAAAPSAIQSTSSP
jgi:uncharacterized caspase-like protein